jgi:ABC-type bacteriocin/lantibiotic exporter with double-glycine peptidase domain
MVHKRLSQFLSLHRYLLPFWDKQLLLFFCALGFTSFSILTPYFSRLVIDYGLMRGDVVIFKVIILCSVVLFIFSALIGIIQKYISFFVVLKMGFKLRMDFYEILSKKPLRFFEQKATGELLYRISADTNGVINLITGTIPTVLLTALKLIAISLLCLWLNWKATLVVCSVMPLFYLLNYYFGKKNFQINKEINEKGQTISKVLQDSLSRIKLYKAFYRERKGLHDYKKEAVSQMRVLIRNFWLGVASSHSHQLLNNGFGLALTIYLGLQVLSGKMTLGSFVALSLYLVQLAGILKSLGGMYQGLVSQFVYVDRFFEIYEWPERRAVLQEKGMSSAYAEHTGALVFKDVSFGYSEEKPVLNNINLSIYPGETIAIIGNSGTGKSTLSGLMLRLYTPDSGSISLYGYDLNRLNEAVIRHTIGIVLQETPLLHKTVKENLLFAQRSVTEEEFLTVSRIAEVDDFIKVKRDGYEMNVGEQGATLSQGERQRIAIAMAMMKAPAILILDEATNQLDQEMERRIIRNIRLHKPHTALVVISCRKNTLAIVDRVFELAEGRLVEVTVPLSNKVRALSI